MRTYFEARLQKAGPQINAAFLRWIRVLGRDNDLEIADEKIAEIVALVDVYKAVIDNYGIDK